MKKFRPMGINIYVPIPDLSNYLFIANLVLFLALPTSPSRYFQANSGHGIIVSVNTSVCMRYNY